MYGQITMRIKHTIKLFTITCLVQGIVLTFSSCATTGPKLKADVIGFADDATKSYEFKSKCLVQTLRKQSEPYDLLPDTIINKKTGKKTVVESQDVATMKKFVDALPQNQNTAGLYALDLAIDRVRYVRRKKSIMGKDPFSKYYIITLTDGLDNISTQVARNNKRRFYNTQEKYEARLKKRMKKATKNIFINFNRPCDLAAHCLVYKGADLDTMQNRMGLGHKKGDSDFIKKEKNKKFDDFLTTQMDVFTGQNGNMEKPKVILGDDFNKILADFSEQFKDASFEFQVPKSYANKNIRMMLVSEKNETIYLEGLYKKGWFGKSKLKDVKVTSSSGDVTFAGLNQKKVVLRARNRDRKDLLSRFCLNSIKLKDKLTGKKDHFEVKNSQQEYKDKRFENMGQSWVLNTEYQHKSEIIPNAYFVFVIDGSDSFKQKISEAKDMVKKIIDEVATNGKSIKNNKTKSKSKTTSKSKSKKQTKK